MQVIAQAFVHRVLYDADAQPRHRRRVPRCGRRGASRGGPRRRARRPRLRDAAPAAPVGPRRLARRSRELERPGRSSLHEPPDMAGVRHVRRADQRVQRHADGPRDGAGLLRPSCRRGVSAGVRAALVHDDAGHLRHAERVVLRLRAQGLSLRLSLTPRRGGRTPKACRTRTIP